MRVETVTTYDGKERYIVVDSSGEPIPIIIKYLKFKDNIGGARNSLRTYSYHLKLYFDYLEQKKLDYTQVKLEDMAEFFQWLKNPYQKLNVSPIQTIESARRPRTVNAVINTVTHFYDYLVRSGNDENTISEQLKRSMLGSQGNFKGFLYHLSKNKSYTKNLLKMKTPKEHPKTLTKEQVKKIMNACTNLRDQFLIQLLWESSMRIGEALSLWLEDFKIDARKIQIQDRGELINFAEIKTVHSCRSIDVSEELINTYLEYISMFHTEEVDTNFVFIKVSGPNKHQPLEYQDIVSLFNRLKAKTGIHCTPHMLRHSSLTTLRRAGWKDEHLMKRAGHAHVQTTIQMYVHPSDEDLKRDWEKVEEKIRIAKNQGETR
ncbi:tyrosine-type recombinase/integrase [Shimazuella sp. AN120528]|uniref:tyrosine-type recombinase/integrase n=1 Tax=Shimazuella soli TaxID=1892854 RepID=UPI001F0D2E16|nr:tyrosine-type recombinase/integrase [Shimazuella soli]